MLDELRVSNFAIIDNIQLTFRQGLNVLSGEMSLVGPRPHATAAKASARWPAFWGRGCATNSVLSPLRRCSARNVAG